MHHRFFAKTFKNIGRNSFTLIFIFEEEGKYFFQVFSDKPSIEAAILVIGCKADFVFCSQFSEDVF